MRYLGIALVVSLLIITGGCSLTSYEPSSEEVKENAKHFNLSHDFSGQIIDITGQDAYSEVSQETVDKIVELNKKALKEAKLVDTKILNSHVSGWGNRYKNDYIAGLEMNIKGYAGLDNDLLIAASLKINKFFDWYNKNVINR